MSEMTVVVVETVTEVVEVATPGTQGPPGEGVPAGGAEGEVLAKASGTDFDTEWSAAAGGGVTDHGALTGLADDDHTQYHTDARGDLRYQPLDSDLTAIAALTTTAFGRALLELANQAALLAAAGAAAASHAHAGEDITSGTVADARIASTIARDSEVTSAISTSEAGQVRDGDAAGGVLSGTYPNPGFAADMATQAELDAHINDAADAHDASAVSVNSTNLSGVGTDVQASLEELDNLLDDHSARHENGGADEISVAGLSGELADPQPTNASKVDSGAATDGQVLTADGAGGSAWETPAGGSGGADPEDESLIVAMEVFA